MLQAVFERFTERARQVIVFAQEESRALGHKHIGSEHLLLGLVRVQDGLAASVLEGLDVTVERVRTEVLRIAPRGEPFASGQMPFTTQAKKVLEGALREALRLSHNYIGTEHLLLALTRDSVAARILRDLDADGEQVRNEVISLLPGGAGDRREIPATELPPHVVLGGAVRLTSRARELMMVAAAQSRDDGRMAIEVRDLLQALAPVLIALGVEDGVMRNAIDRVGPDEEPPRASS